MFFHLKGRQYCVDATEETGRLGRLLNHSCKHPNLIPKVLKLQILLIWSLKCLFCR